jgi:hypothetical protein
VTKRRDLTPVSYLKHTQVSGYTRKDGRHVYGYLRTRWVVEFPVPLEELDLADFGREKFPIQEALRPGREVPFKTSRSDWQNVQEYVLDLYDEYEWFDLTDPIARMNEEQDLIAPDGFVWEHTLDTRSMYDLKLDEIYLVRVWVLLFDRSRGIYFTWCRARSLLLRPEASRQDLAAAYGEVLDIYDGIVEWAEENTDYLEVRKMLAWTVNGRPIGSKDGEKFQWKKRDD